ncbi:hypothetical protein ABIH81_06015 [Micromonospora sp. HUAS YX12]|uniref:Uncharacterized protein n=1 Tax=Micromonospora sp. HUAS YX12 TaxID=3156396 RepID=A0AAU7R4Z4_9ACTN
MGNSAWGNGYHQGFDDGFAKGAKGTAAGWIVAGATAVVSLAAFGYRELKARSLVEREQVPAEDSNPAATGGAGDEHDAGKGPTSL